MEDLARRRAWHLGFTDESNRAGTLVARHLVAAPIDHVLLARVHAVIVLHDGAAATTEALLDWCKDRIAGYKRPRSLTILSEAEMPRTATGKILHRELKARIAKPQS